MISDTESVFAFLAGKLRNNNSMSMCRLVPRVFMPALAAGFASLAVLIAHLLAVNGAKNILKSHCAIRE